MHPVISAVLIMAFSIAIVGMVVSFGMPLIESKKQALDLENGRTLVNQISAAVDDLADDPITSSKYAEIDFGSGYLEFSGHDVSFHVGSLDYTRSFDGADFNKLIVNPGRSSVKMTKISIREIHVNLE
jgi:hypothetical protein